MAARTTTIPREFHGRPASPGVAVGPLVRIDAMPRARSPAAPAGGGAALCGAIAAAIDDLSALRAGSAGTDAAGMLDFQIEMLRDATLHEPALAAIAAGASAASAWTTALGAQIADFEAARDERFRARAADLRDLRDRVLRHLTGLPAPERAPPGAVLVAADLTPSRFLETDWSAGGGIALEAGSPASHVAMLARARGVPMVVGLGPLPVPDHVEAALDGTAGRLLLEPGARERAGMAARAAHGRPGHGILDEVARRPARTADGVPIRVLLNIAGPDEVRGLDPAICDGIGLVRTELLFHGPGGLPDEEHQYAAYRAILAWAEGRPVAIRSLDAGGDKPIPGFTPEGESNPFLGMRGIRLSLARPDVLAVQFRALARAAVHGTLKVMLPMVTLPQEMHAAGRILDDALAALQAAGVACRRPPLGMMVEVPAAALSIAAFDAAFFSIGSNDLTQYVTASARDIAAVAGLADPANPAVLRLIGEVAAHGAASGREVTVCGDMAGDPAHTAALLAAGVTALSMPPNCVGAVKASIARLRCAP
jgi:phosphotransferase system enzyme I (PtsI)